MWPFRNKKKIIFDKKKSGANQYNEITHYINKYFPDVNELLQTVIHVYISKDKKHFGKSLVYQMTGVNEYLSRHNKIHLSESPGLIFR